MNSRTQYTRRYCLECMTEHTLEITRPFGRERETCHGERWNPARLPGYVRRVAGDVYEHIQTNPAARVLPWNGKS
jgi:hypothetical protein